MSDPLGRILAPERLIDLTQPLGPDTVLWPGSSPVRARAVATYDAEGYYARDLALPEHAGTHLDAPAHFDPAGATADRLPLALLVRPAVCVDVRDRVEDDPGYALGADELAAREAAHGPLPRGCALLVCTGADQRRTGSPDDGRLPGVGPDAAALALARGVVGIGIDTLSVDSSSAGDFPVHRMTLPAGLWHLEGLVGLERVPARGAWLVAGVVPAVGGSGAPARVFAVLPPDAEPPVPRS